MSLKQFLQTVILLATLMPLCAAEPLWTRVLAGDIIAGPVVYHDRVYLAGSDRTVTCLSQKGDFLWSKSISGKISPFLTVTSSGMILAVSGIGTITALNMDGVFLWQLGSRDLPVLPFHEGRDGRIFAIFANRIVCLSSSAAVKWTLPLDEKPVSLSAETGNGDLLLVTGSGVILRISPWGELLERFQLPDIPAAIIPLDSGFAAGFRSGAIQSYDVRNARSGRSKKDTEFLWESRMKTSIAALATDEGTLLALSSDGSLFGLNITDGALLWTSSTGHATSGVASVTVDYGQFNIACSGFACGRTPQGRPVWEIEIPVSPIHPVLSGNGLAFASANRSSISAFRAESRITSEKKTHKTQNYGILKGSSAEYRTPFAADRVIVAEFFARAERDIESGNVGPDEVSYARRLSEIIRNDSAGALYGRSYDPSERGRAACLLGKLGSNEYRNVLFDAASGETDPTVTLGILYGISALGCDIDGKALETVLLISREAGIDRTEVQRASCDALYSIIRYSGGKTALEGVTALTKFSQSPYGNLVREYARQVMGNILH